MQTDFRCGLWYCSVLSVVCLCVCVCVCVCVFVVCCLATQISKTHISLLARVVYVIAQ